MNPPAHLPATEADLDEWSVFVDWLLTIEDMRAEFLAFELALPAQPEAEALAAFRAMARKWCRVRPATPAAWCLGHARTLSIPGERPLMMGYPRTRSEPSTGAMSNATEFFKTAAGSRVEQLDVPAPYDRIAIARPWRRLMSAIPASCSAMQLDIRGGVDDPGALIDSLPDHVTTLIVGNERADIAGAVRLISDRFDVVDFRYPRIDEAGFQIVRDALRGTSHVVVRVSELYRSASHPRIELGGPGDAALVQPATEFGVALRRDHLLEQQKRYDTIPVRMQVAGLAERYTLRRWPDGRISSFNGDADLMRRGDRWTLRGDPNHAFSHNGHTLEPGEIVAVIDRDTIAIDDAPPCTFFADANAGCRSLGW
jgi:hypothetical protein